MLLLLLFFLMYCKHFRFHYAVVCITINRFIECLSIVRICETCKQLWVFFVVIWNALHANFHCEVKQSKAHYSYTSCILLLTIFHCLEFLYHSLWTLIFCVRNLKQTLVQKGKMRNTALYYIIVSRKLK